MPNYIPHGAPQRVLKLLVLMGRHNILSESSDNALQEVITDRSGMRGKRSGRRNFRGRNNCRGSRRGQRGQKGQLKEHEEATAGPWRDGRYP